MPELPEVETVARQLAPLTEGQTIRAVKDLDPLLRFTNHTNRIKGRVIGRIRRVGKQLSIRLDDPRGGDPLWLAVHLRMTGRMICFEPGQEPPNDGKHMRLRILLDHGFIGFIDPRRFGTLKLCRTESEMAPPGDEPLARSFTVKRLEELLQNAKGEIKPWLLRQDKITGLGNIYASEILFTAGIHPRRIAGSLNQKEIARLHNATVKTLRLAIKHCGTTVSDFQAAHQMTGSYQNLLLVYKRHGQPCKKCRAPIQRIVQQQRSTFFCAKCQS
ncbi:bifunctional DNA-formamidopyrimidine glycosylase/DNA-(apurinic or apyrimidinic site) lyase [Candidatus Sumerlaeota bacterium]|nr:bifunctional DNA-formamidopyrimidine glycosylase/DNA-(apurinic or apyrimidinic site) lyase [Candidatus Sumerlaeota bacterium]